MQILNDNPTLWNPAQPYGISFYQTKDTLMDTDIYLRFIRSAESRFRASRFYKQYKSYIMDLGIYRDQRHPSLTSEMVEIEMHHNFLTLEYMAIILTEYTLKTSGRIDTFTLEQLLEEQHRENRISVIMLSETEHQAHHANPTDFISNRQCFGNPYEFLNRYIDGMTLDISFNLLMHLRQEEQYGGSHDTNIITARNEILSWQQNNNY